MMPTEPLLPPAPVAPIDGRCDPRFGALRDAFAENFAQRDECGAAVCVRIGGRVVADLWGGFADAARTRPWRRDTLVNAYSVGKGVTTALVLRVVASGALAFDAPVARVWPELATAGKEILTLRMLLAHRAGLPAVREPLPPGAMLDWDAMCRALAAQTPWWEPDTAHGYHTNTFGFLVGELVRRATGFRVGEALRRLVTGPLDADYHVGLPASEHRRAAEVFGLGVGVVAPEFLEHYPQPSTGDPERDRMIRHGYFNPPGLSGAGVVNTPAWREAEIPSTNGHGTARAVAAIYAALLAGEASPLGLPAAVRDEALRIHSDGIDRILDRPTRFGLGFQLAQPERPLGRSPQGYGHYGFGGSLGFADPEADLAFGYVMNHPGSRWQTPRTAALVDALYGCL